MDRIIMKNMKFLACHGVLETEKKNPQPFEVDCTIYFEASSAVLTDNLEHTVNYSRAYDIVKGIVTGNSFNLIEKLAGSIGDSLLSAFDRICKVEVEVRKPQAPIDGSFDYMGVSVVRSRQFYEGQPAKPKA